MSDDSKNDLETKRDGLIGLLKKTADSLKEKGIDSFSYEDGVREFVRVMKIPEDAIPSLMELIKAGAPPDHPLIAMAGIAGFGRVLIRTPEGIYRAVCVGGEKENDSPNHESHTHDLGTHCPKSIQTAVRELMGKLSAAVQFDMAARMIKNGHDLDKIGLADFWTIA